MLRFAEIKVRITHTGMEPREEMGIASTGSGNEGCELAGLWYSVTDLRILDVEISRWVSGFH